MSVHGGRGFSRAFTLIELITVVAIITMLAAILIPTLGGARVAANKAKTRVLFSQWAAAIEGFRDAHGHYPAFHVSNLVNGGVTGSDHPFHDLLAARRRDGRPLDNASTAALQNRRRTAFYSFGDSDFTTATGGAVAGLLRDAFGNTEIAVLVDRNLDGLINAADFGTLPLVSGLRPGADDFATAGVRAGVVFYAALPDATADSPRFVLSWK